MNRRQVRMETGIENVTAPSAENPVELIAATNDQETAGWSCRLGRIRGLSRSAKIVVCIFVFSLLDAFFTILLTSRGAVELNPLMAFYLNEGPHLFIAVKVFLTCSALFIFFVYRKEAIRKLNIRISHLLPVISAVFILLLGWEMYLFYQLFR